MAEVVGHSRHGCGDGTAEGGWPVGDAPHERACPRLLPGRPACCQVGVGGRQHAARAPPGARQTIPQHPEDCRADLRWQAIDPREDAPAVPRGALLQAVRRGQRADHAGIGALQEMLHGPGRHRHTAADQLLLALGKTAGVGRAQRAHQGEDLEAHRRRGEGEPACGLGPLGPLHLWTGGVETPADGARQPEDRVQRGDGPLVVIRRPHRLPAGRPMAQERLQGVRGGGDGPGRETGQRQGLHASPSRWDRHHLLQALAQFTVLEKNRRDRLIRLAMG
jgi:hypothetical protein